MLREFNNLVMTDEELKTKIIKEFATILMDEANKIIKEEGKEKFTHCIKGDK